MIWLVYFLVCAAGGVKIGWDRATIRRLRAELAPLQAADRQRKAAEMWVETLKAHPQIGAYRRTLATREPWQETATSYWQKASALQPHMVVHRDGRVDLAPLPEPPRCEEFKACPPECAMGCERDPVVCTSCRRHLGCHILPQPFRCARCKSPQVFKIGMGAAAAPLENLARDIDESVLRRKKFLAKLATALEHRGGKLEQPEFGRNKDGTGYWDVVVLWGNATYQKGRVEIQKRNPYSAETLRLAVAWLLTVRDAPPAGG